MIGIVGYGAYIPRLRLSRKSIVQHIAWRQPGLAGFAQGEKAMCNWDEDSITMAVAAARDCLRGVDRATVDAVYIASTTLPFVDRLASTVVSTALNLSEHIGAADFTTSQKAGTAALLAGLDAVGAGSKKNVLVAATDKRDTRPASNGEMLFGDGAAAVLLGQHDVIAALKGSYSVSCDFVDHHRGAQKRFDYTWEERWVRDEGYLKLVPEAINGLLGKVGLTIDQIDKIAFACPVKRDHQGIAKAIGAAPSKVVDNMHEVCGETGAAHPLVMLVSALENAAPGERIVVAGFGQGCDALCFEVTENIRKLAPRLGVRGSLADRKATDAYMKYLVFRGLLETETGIRSEAPAQTALTTLWRRRRTVLGMVGAKCLKCGTPQFPPHPVCVNPECGAIEQFEPYPFQDAAAAVKSFTADHLAASVEPPTIFGMVEFQDGGRYLADFTDCELADIKVGLPVRLVFRRHVVDADRGFTAYFWKATPAVRGEQGEQTNKAG